MPDIDFEMTYPCYFLLTESGDLRETVSDGDRCICLFTDDDLAKTYHAHTFHTREFDVMVIHNQPALVDYVREVQTHLAERDVLHLAIDLTPGKMVGRVLIAEFIEEMGPG